MSPLPSWEERGARVLSSYTAGSLGGRLRAPGPRPVARTTGQRPIVKSLRPATVVVAPSNSHDTTTADVVLTGTADEVLLNDALATVTAYGASVLLLDGDVNIAGDVLVPASARLWSVGQGAVSINASGAHGVRLTGAAAEVSDLFVYGPGTGSGVGVSVEGYACAVRSCYVDNYATGIVGLGAGTDSRQAQIVDNIIYGCALGVSTASIEALIKNNRFILNEAGVLIDGNQSQVLGNYFDGSQSPYGDAITLTAGLTQVLNNYIYRHRRGVYAQSFESEIIGNYIYGTRREGIYIEENDAFVSANYVKGAGVETINTYDAIRVFVGDRVSVMANRANSANTRYGIRIDAGVTNALVVNNDLKSNGAWGTAAFSDAGTGTVFNLDGSSANWNRV